MSTFKAVLRARVGHGAFSAEGSIRPRLVRRAPGHHIYRRTMRRIVSAQGVSLMEAKSDNQLDEAEPIMPPLNEPVDPKIVVETFDDDTEVKGTVFLSQIEKGEDLTKVRERYEQYSKART